MNMKKFMEAGKLVGGIGVAIYIWHMLYLRKEDRRKIMVYKKDAKFWEDQWSKMNSKHARQWANNLTWKMLYRKYGMDISDPIDRAAVSLLNSDVEPKYIDDED